jgi:uncharacterized SAM-binding protein YcdF (DUF218 family)
MTSQTRPARVRRVLRVGVRLAAAIVAFGVVYVAVTFVQVWHASRQDHHQPAAAIVVLGAAQYDGRPSPVLQARLDRAFELYQQGLAPLLVTTGANQEGDRFTEAFAGYQYLLSRGVPDESIVVIDTGTNTWEELSATADEMQTRSARSSPARVRVLLVSDSYHSLRLEHTAREVGLDPLVAPTGPGASTSRLLRETAAVSIGRVVGYRRLAELTS